MSNLLFIKTLWKGKLLRTMLLLATFFVIGYTGVERAAHVYERLYPAWLFGQTQQERGSFLYFHTIGGFRMDLNDFTPYVMEQGRLLSRKKQVEQVYYSSNLSCNLAGEATNHYFSMTAFSKGYLAHISRMFTDKLDDVQLDKDTLPVYLPYALAGKFPLGSKHSALVDYSYSSFTGIDLTVQVAGFLPKEGLTPFAPSFYLGSPPDWGDLYQVDSKEYSSHALIAPLETLDQLTARQASTLPYNTLATNIVGLRLLPGLTKQQQEALQRELAAEGLGYGYDAAQIRVSSGKADWASLKRTVITGFVYLVIALLGTAGMLSSIVSGAREKAQVLRVLGASWDSILAKLLIPAVLLCALFCVGGAMVKAYTSAAYMTKMDTKHVVWLPYAIPALLFVTMVLQAGITWLFMRGTDTIRS